MQLTDLTDQQLVDRANAGEAAAFDTLYQRYKDWAFRLALRETGRDEGLAADAVQDSFLYVLKKFPGFELQAKLTTFLYPVVKHNAQSADRKRRRKTPSGPQTDSADDTDSEPEPDRLDGLRSILDTLPEHQREVVFMRFLDDMSLNEIALALCIPLGTVKSRLHHAIGALREEPACRAYFDIDP